MKRPFNRGSRLDVMQVAETYAQESGSIECDVLDKQGRIYFGCSVLSLGGGKTDISSAPEVGAEVVCVTEPYATPYIIGVLADSQRYVESVDLNNGEYPSQKLSIKDVELKNDNTRLVATSEALHASPKLRVQGRLEISNGNLPDQSAAIAEPVIELLTSYQSAITELQTALVGLQTQLAAQQPPVVVTLPPLSLIQPPSDIIKSELVKVER